jgi:hypothetical protein
MILVVEVIIRFLIITGITSVLWMPRAACSRSTSETHIEQRCFNSGRRSIGSKTILERQASRDFGQPFNSNNTVCSIWECGYGNSPSFNTFENKPYRAILKYLHRYCCYLRSVLNSLCGALFVRKWNAFILRKIQTSVEKSRNMGVRTLCHYKYHYSYQNKEIWDKICNVCLIRQALHFDTESKESTFEN